MKKTRYFRRFEFHNSLFVVFLYARGRSKFDLFGELNLVNFNRTIRNVFHDAPQDILRLLNESEGNVFHVPANGTEKKIMFRIEKVAHEPLLLLGFNSV